MSLGDLQAELLGVLQRLGKGSAREVMVELGTERHLAYTTVSTVLDRLYRKGLLRRTRASGRGGAKYIYSYAAAPDTQTTFVNKALSGLVNAFGPSIVPTIYSSLEQLSKEETADLKRRVAKTKR